MRSDGMLFYVAFKEARCHIPPGFTTYHIITWTNEVINALHAGSVREQM